AASPTRQTSTWRPAAWSLRAATYPSPPLLPGPATTRKRATGPPSVAAASAVAVPAFSIRTDGGSPRRSASASAARVSAAVRSGCIGGTPERAAEGGEPQVHRPTQRHPRDLETRLHPPCANLGAM